MASFVLFIVLFTPTALAQFSIQGCPMWGCSSQGTFSILMDNPPMENVSVLWKRDPSGEGMELPPPQGCASDGDNAVCLVPGTTSNEVGFEASSGDLMFTDKELRDPTVPVIALGGATFSMDKGHLQCRLPNGTVCGTSIPLKDFPGVYNLVVSEDGFLLITVPIWGLLVVYLTAGIPHASIYLDQTVAGVNGTFLPVAQPVIDGKRAYFLTKFGPSHWEKPSPEPYPLEYRVYRVDLTTQMAPRMVIRWYYPLVPNSQGRLVPKEPVMVDNSNYNGDVSGDGTGDSSADDILARTKWEWAPDIGDNEQVDHRKMFGSEFLRNKNRKMTSKFEGLDEQNKVDSFWNDITKFLDRSDGTGFESSQKSGGLKVNEAGYTQDKRSQKPPKNDPFNIYRNLLLADNGRIYVSFIAKDMGNEQAILPQLFLFEESPKEGEPPTVIKSISDSVASLAMRQEINFQNSDDTKDKPSSPLPDSEDKRYLWSLMGQDVLVALDPEDLSYARLGNLSEMIGTKLNVTSKIMVLWSGGSTSKAKETLVFGVTFETPPNWKTLKTGQKHSSGKKQTESGSLNYVVAVDEYLNLLWKLAVPDDSPVVGQMAGYSGPSDNGLVIASTAKGTVFAIKG
ncbi:uncharacterized protein LOC118414795 [Branchiostoma floridae]|uniref:Uncharacterized protein LOC118414795 n=1 Tax=Branchiostoma floridae TaxID=7739 RepID=C3Y6H2_BRAFL|nr:uncharacterized protein LOC118414795 [Branchiostoma floridae]|eukprot:XP_002607922.1 hypothetical protein BRAFLDRAFT_120845 [Branchiostoma floridae]